MITIKEFASLCGCNAQTLRYYDKIDLLKPVKVDQWSGYRYYAKTQAIDFVRIKNLQAADFSIEEIKTLLTLSDSQVYDAFDRKIAEQSQKLERIREIQRSYLTEVNTMKKTINSFCDHLLQRANDPEMLSEFGMTKENTSSLVEAVRILLFSRAEKSHTQPQGVTMTVNDQLFEGETAVEKMTFLLREEEMDDVVHLSADNIKREPFRITEDMKTVWQVHGWHSAREFLGQIPPLEDGTKYIILIRAHEKPICHTLSYPMFMIAAILLKGHHAATDMSCTVESSDDGQNHFVLLRKTE
jgi:DNA-binding transcriptional MerR regulator